MITRLLVLIAMTTLAGCMNMNYKLQQAGPATVGALKVTANDAWNVVPPAMAPFARKESQVWTHDGVFLDRLLIIPGVPEGEPLFKEADKAVALPRFKADMLPDEIVQFTESSITKLLGEGQTVVKSSNLRPARFGENRGILFDVAATPTEGPNYRGLAGAFIADKKLHVVLYIAADPYYFDLHRDAVQSLIASARI